MTKSIQRVAVLGAGTMGARIAAHMANAGVPCYLLDIVPPGATGADRNKIAAGGLQAALKSKPAAFFDPSLARLVTVGNFEDDLKLIANADWIIEAVLEDLEIKRNLLRKVEAIRRPGSIVTTNTSGLPVSRIAEGFSQDFRRAWFGTHFFNPPRYMRLLEVIPTPESDPALVEAVSRFSDVRLGKGIVMAKDTPNFITNRIGTFSVLNVMRVMQDMDLSIEEVDALTGPAVGWPRSATFRTIDIVGLDVLGHVVNNLKENAHDERSDLHLPQFFLKMLEQKQLGDKTGGGFYRQPKPGEAKDGDRLALDWHTMEYRPRKKAQFPALEMAKNVEEPGQRVRMLLGLNGAPPQKNDKAGQFLWTTLTDLWTYSANRLPEIADSVVAVDRAMRLGFNWDMGPFELWDAAGVAPTVERMKKEGRAVAASVERLLSSGKKSWYEDAPSTPAARTFFDLSCTCNEPVPLPTGVILLEAAKKSRGAVTNNAGASLVDVGNGVGCIEFHSKMNSLGGDIVQLITQTLRPGGPGDAFDAFVITHAAANFSVGANVMLLLMAVQDEDWDEVDMAIRAFQGMTQAIKFSPKPVVVAPFGMTLGGGCEISLHAPVRQPHAELYMGLVEVGVGLLPGGGGCKEMLLRALASAEAVRPGSGASAKENR